MHAVSLTPDERVHAVSLTPHEQQNFRTTSKSENNMEIGDAMQKKLKIHATTMTTHARFLRSKSI
jgi:hypothetical protein